MAGASGVRVQIQQTFNKLPGCVHVRGALVGTDLSTAASNAQSIANAARTQAFQLAPFQQKRRSPKHNINQREEYMPIQLQLGERLLNAEHFSKYGEGHELTYFRGNQNVPPLGVPGLPEMLAALPVVQDELRASRARRRRPQSTPITWRLTLNRYPASTSRTPGFPWHRDLHDNGAASLIVALSSSATLQFAEPPATKAQHTDGLLYSDGETRTDEAEAGGTSASSVQAAATVASPTQSSHPTSLTVPPSPRVLGDVTLEAGDVLLLTGAARWELLHRVMPREGDAAAQERISLVYGCW
mmetsp:Transcript_28659/g.60236  ORF Transcript_28659/g.60236 Transcript_28659/m.60236 type:complete len:300 (-) Transcript_28659:693-1592(-)